jgi:hypothetical protein
VETSTPSPTFCRQLRPHPVSETSNWPATIEVRFRRAWTSPHTGSRHREGHQEAHSVPSSPQASASSSPHASNPSVSVERAGGHPLNATPCWPTPILRRSRLVCPSTTCSTTKPAPRPPPCRPRTTEPACASRPRYYSHLRTTQRCRRCTHRRRPSSLFMLWSRHGSSCRRDACDVRKYGTSAPLHKSYLRHDLRRLDTKSGMFIFGGS